MNDDAIRELLARLPASRFIPTEAGHVAIPRSRVVDAKADPDQVAEWVERVGGYVDQTNPMKGSGRKGKQQGEVFYAVPRKALGGG